MSKRKRDNSKAAVQEAAQRQNVQASDNRSMLENKYVITWLVLFVMLAGIIMRTNYLKIDDYRSGADEGFYVRYGVYMATEKGASIRALSDEYMRNKDWQMFPNPLRAGHIMLSALWMKLMNRADFKALSAMSSFFSVLLLFLGYLFTRRLFDKKIAILSLVLLSTSPLALAMGRRALQDSVVYFFIIASLYIFYEALQSKKIVYSLLFIPTFYMAIMVKETSILLGVFFFAYMVYERTFVKKDLNIIPILLALTVVFLLTGISYLAITGGPDQFLKLIRIILLSPATNEYAVRYQSGPIYRYLYDFFLISPLTFILSGFFCVAYCVNAKIRTEPSRYLLWFFIIMYILFSFFSKNLRYVMALDFPIRVFAALAVWAVCSKMGRIGTIIALAAVILMAVFDFGFFKHIFIKCQVYDPVTQELLNGWQRF